MNETARIIRLNQTGPSSVLEFSTEDIPIPSGHEVRLKVQAIGLNRAEIMFREGAYLEQPQFPSKIGYEASGIVEAIGPEVIEFQVGDLVSSIPAFSMTEYGVYGDKVLVPADALSKYPQKLSPEEATSIWMQFITAYGALIDIGNLQKEQHILITAASSSVGVAAIQIAKLIGAVAIATSRSDKKKESLIKHGADHVIVTDHDDISERVNQITSNSGVDLIFDPIGGPGIYKLAEASKAGGRIIEYGALDPEPTPYPLFQALGKGLTIHGYTLFEVTKNKDRLKRAKEFIFQGLNEGKLYPIIDRKFEFDQIKDAQEYMEQNNQIGKIVVTVSKNK
jgi:NADPH:quinone reductase-like Zn-dependent oxidoreductase